MASGWHDEDAPRIEPAAGGRPDGAYAAIAPDPERDARRDAYRERERRRAARALDRYLEAHEHAVSGTGPIGLMNAAGERFVEAVGDYVLSRIGEPPWPWCEHGVRPGQCGSCKLQQNRDYAPFRNGDAVIHKPTGRTAVIHHPCAGGRCPDPAAHAEGAHDL